MKVFTDFSHYIWEKKYKTPEEKTVEDTFKRISSAIFPDDEKKRERLFKALSEFKVSFGGRITANVGRKDVKNATLMNCYGSMGVAFKDIDSINGIYEELKFAAKTLVSEGGWGINASFLRPAGTVVEGTGIVTPGPVKFMELFDKSAEVVVSDYETEVYQGKRKKTESRKGAQMLVLEDWHPDIIEFIHAKQVGNRLAHFNISVGVSNFFMQAVNNNEDTFIVYRRNKENKIVTEFIKPDTNEYSKIKTLYESFTKIKKELIYPEDIVLITKGREWALIYPSLKEKKIYEEEWDGNIWKWLANGHHVYLYKIVDAKDLWENHIIKSAIDYAEPGVLFLDTMNSFNNLAILGQRITGTNPCVTGDTWIWTNKGMLTMKELKELYDKKQTDDILVRGWNFKEGVGSWQKIEWVGITKENEKIYRVWFRGNHYVRVNEDHTFYEDTGPSGELYKEITVKEIIERLEKGERIFVYGYKNIEEIKAVEEDGVEDVYDMTAKPHLNFFAQGTPTTPPVLMKDCGEIPVIGNVYKDDKIGLYGGDNCNLGSINVARLVKQEGKDVYFDWEEYIELIELMIEALDRVLDLTKYPHEYYEKAASLRRKVGLGILGLGSLFYILGYRYGDEKSVDFTEKLIKTLSNVSYKTSAKLAQKLGAFPLWNKEMINAGFIKYAIDNKIFDNETIELIEKYGLRNSQLNAIAPTGSISLFLGVVSGGHEPVFMKEYVRWHSVFKHETPYKDKKIPDVTKGEWFETEDFKKSKEGIEEILISKDGNYKIEKTRGLVKKQIVRDYGYRYVLENNLERDESVLAGALELSVEEHLKIHEAVSKYLDQGVSKTINIPKDFKDESVVELYNRLWKNKVKGVTIYKEGSRTMVLETKESADAKAETEKRKTEIEKTFEKYGDKVIPKDLKIPYEMIGKTIKKKAEGKKWYFHITYVDNEMTKPFAIFIQSNHYEAPKYKKALIFELIELAKEMGIDEKLIYDHIEKLESGNVNVTDRLSRWVSFCLRHNIPLVKIIERIEKVGATINSVVYHLKHVLIEHLPKDKEIETGLICPVCGAKMVIENGCYKCLNCGHSKCA